MKNKTKITIFAWINILFTLLFCFQSAKAQSGKENFFDQITNPQQENFENNEQTQQEKIDFFQIIDNTIAQTQIQGIQNEFSELNSEVLNLWEQKDVAQMVTTIAKGESIVDSTLFFENIWGFAKATIAKNLNIVCVLIVLGILAGIIEQLQSSFGNATGETANFVVYAMSMIVVVFCFSQSVVEAKNAITKTVQIMEACFPPLLTLLSASGATTSAGIMQPATALLSTSVSKISKSILMPLVLTMGVTSIMGNLSQSLQLSKLQKLLKTTTKWALGALSTIYIGITSLQGIAAKGADTLAMRTTRFALDKFVPYVGGIMSGSAQTIAGVSNLVKNAVGITSVIIMGSAIFAPLLRILALQLALRLSCAIVEPLGNEKLSKSIGEIADVINYLFAIVAVCALMFVLTVGIIMSAGSNI